MENLTKVDHLDWERESHNKMLEGFLILVCFFGIGLVFVGLDRWYQGGSWDGDWVWFVSGIIILTVIFLLTPFG